MEIKHQITWNKEPYDVVESVFPDEGELYVYEYSLVEDQPGETYSKTSKVIHFELTDDKKFAIRINRDGLDRLTYFYVCELNGQYSTGTHVNEDSLYKTETEITKSGDYVLYVKLYLGDYNKGITPDEVLRRIEIVTTTTVHPVEEVEIEEPIGFDDLETSIERGDYHGMSVEASVGTIKFYNLAYEVIKEAYEADIDKECIYRVLNGSDVLYQGAIDLSTCSFNDADYRSVSAKVAEIGAKTTFNNRTDTDVDIDGGKTVDGTNIDASTFKDSNIPVKHLRYTNSINSTKEKVVYTNYDWRGHEVSYSVCPDDPQINEFGTFCSDGVLFAKDADFDKNFGIDTKIKVSLNASLKFTRGTLAVTGSYDRWGYIRIIRRDNNGETVLKEVTFDPTNSSATKTISYTGEIETGAIIIRVIMWASPTDKFICTDLKATLTSANIRLLMYDTLNYAEAPTRMVSVHDAMNAISRAVSENQLLVKSDWYGRTDSQFMPTSEDGGGAMRSLTNGYKIRNLFTTGTENRNMPISFKTMIEAINMLDCIGWGFSTEDGTTYVRVEPWGWFYKDDVLAVLTGVNEITTNVNTDAIATSLEIAYKKYETSDTFNSIDSVHGERTFTSAIKALKGEFSGECEFIADNYAIELTRRARTEKDASEEFGYDENIFIFELERDGDTLVVSHPVVSATDLERIGEQINMGITPRRCAERWRSYLFASTSKSGMRFTSGEINYKAAIKLQGESEELAENADIAYEHAKFRAETMEFECPITVAQYKNIISNPYGLVSVNGTLGWIKKFKYKFMTGKANFTLIPKYNA